MIMDKFIKVYKASAGAGKTHTLTQEYIKLILKDEEAYKHVLAVTFTNKATDEMKQRILAELHKMASDVASPYREQARRVLIKILHDYPAFSVSTIDRFFQKVIRAFARELGRNITYSVELDEKMVVAQAVDNMFADLEKEGNGELLEWLIAFSLERIENGDSWKINDSIANLAKNIFSEKFKVKSGNMEQDRMAGVLELKERIAAIISDFERKSKKIGCEALAIMERSGLAWTDFAGASRGPFAIFYKLSQGESVGEPLKEKFINCHDNVEVWYPSKRAKEAYKYEDAYNSGLNECIGMLKSLVEDGAELYNTALCVKDNLGILGIFGTIYSYIMEYCREKNVLMLSETTMMLTRLIDGSDTPFIYEKVGTWINNFMLDEFQDTSILQWKNFVPLLANSIANGEKNLAVGDIKQCIYRFRNSDWSILQREIEREFPGKVDSVPMAENWRSASNIVNFNNRFFEAAAVDASRLYEPLGAEASSESFGRAAQIREIYSGFAQKLSPKSSEGGVVRVNFINKERLKELAESASGADEEITYDSAVKAHLLAIVRDLLDRGFSQRDIGILVRYNSEAAFVARALMEADSNYKVVSADSLAVSSSPVVLKIVNILKWLNEPDEFSLAVYSALEEGNVHNLDVDSLKFERLEKLPLYQMCEEIVRCCLADEERKDLVFIQAFLDLVLDYSVNEGSNLNGFLKWWNDGGKNKSISFPEEQDAFQVMTVHKAKGLDFEAVILPYFSERLDYAGNRQPLLWSTAASDLLSYDEPLPVRYGQRLKETSFAEDYLQEKLEVYIDNLNVAYVAFTRPRCELSIIAEEPKETKSGSKMESVANLLYKFLDGGYMESNLFSKQTLLPGLEVKSSLNSIDVDGTSVEYKGYVVGVPAGPSGKRRRMYGKYEVKEQFDVPVNMERLKTSLQSGSINDDTTIRNKGIEMHDIFASVTDVDDIDRIEDDENRNLVAKMIASVAKMGWFSDKYEILKECTIIKPDGTLLRPDRVMVNDNEAVVVDYKFGEYSPSNKKYHKQVRSYMQLLMDMGYTKVTGYLWYPLANAVEEVR